METQTLDIPVIWPNYFEDCEECIKRLKDILAELDGMQSIEVDTAKRALLLTYDKEMVTFEEIQEHARLAGVTIAEQYKHEIIQIAGLDCPDCASKLETAIKRMDGVIWASLSYATSLLVVEFEQRQISLEAIKSRVAGFGYEVQESGPAGPPNPRTIRLRSLRTNLTITSGLLMAAGLITQYVLHNASFAASFFIASAIIGGFFAARSGMLSARALTPDTNFLMSIAALGALWLGDYFEAAAVMFLFSVGSTLEASTVEKTRRSLRSLIEAFPTHATVKHHGHLEERHLHDIEIGDIVIIKPGEKVAVDGTIIDGESAINEAPITGEATPKTKSLGDTVYAGSINGRGALEVRTTTNVEDNTLSRIVHLVEEAHAQRAPSQRFTERFGRIYTPTVIMLAIIVAIAGPLIWGGPFGDWLTRALTLLVVSCPCALVISTPVAIVAAIGNAAKSGVLIKGGAHLEMLAEVSVVAFDKTGTLTIGKPTVTEVVSFDGHSTDEIMGVAAGVESRSEHPLADAIINKAKELEIAELSPAFFEAFPGKGARAVVDGGVFYLGSKRFIEESGFTVPEKDAVERLLAKGHTVVFLAGEDGLWGAIAATDILKQTSLEALIRLKSAGIRKTVMLTGDTNETAKAITAHLGIDEHFAQLLPEDKLAKIHALAMGGVRVAMVGDGINDAPALAAASVGIAMGGAGSHAAIEAADVALMGDDIVMLPYAITLSRKAKTIIKQNVAFAVFVVVVLVIGALTKKVSLATGVLGHEGSALLVIANSMRLLKR